MLTPSFKLDQNDLMVTFCIKAPYANVSETEIFVESDEFKFFSKPYFLRLNLPGELVEDGRENAKYDSEKGEFIIKFPKKIQGENFEGLDLLTKLLTPKGESSASQPLVEFIGSNPELAPSEILEDDEIDWYIEQHTPDPDSHPVTAQHLYGFGQKKTQVFKGLKEELKYLIDIKNPEEISNLERVKLCDQQETEKFDEEHYLADLYHDDEIRETLRYVPSWSGSKDNENIMSCSLSEDDNMRMCNLPKRTYLLTQDELKSVYFSLIDIIYAYCYNHRITEGENTVESGWNICKLSSTLSWFCHKPNVKETVISSLRRSLCFPLFRNWKLSLQVLKDTHEIFSLGKNQILKCLLEIYSLFIDEDSRYILNDLYITDYCVWIQSASDKHIQSLAKKLSNLTITKDLVRLNLSELEQASRIVLEEELSTDLSNLQVKDSDDESEDSESDSENESESESDSENDSDSEIGMESENHSKNSDETNFDK